jgi:hypothetical protein
MKSIFYTFLFLAIIPVLTFAAGNPDGTLAPKLVPDCAPHCSWVHLVQLANNLLNFLIYISIIVAAIMFAYAGFLYMSDGGSMSKVKEAHGIFTSVAVGIIIVLVAWLGIDTLLKSLTGKGLKEWSKTSDAGLIVEHRTFL